MITRSMVRSGEATHDHYLREVAQSAGIVVISAAVLVALNGNDREFGNVPFETWKLLATQNKTPITKALEDRGDLWTDARGAEVVKAAAQRTFDSLKNMKGLVNG